MSPMKNESLMNSNLKDRMQAMQIINQFIKETSGTASPQKSVYKANGESGDPYNNYLSSSVINEPLRQANPQSKQYFGSPEKKQMLQH